MPSMPPPAGPIAVHDCRFEITYSADELRIYEREVLLVREHPREIPASLAGQRPSR